MIVYIFMQIVCIVECFNMCLMVSNNLFPISFTDLGVSGEWRECAYDMGSVYTHEGDEC